MIGAGIHPGDLLVVDRSLQPTNGKIIIAVVDGELLVKRLRVTSGQVTLMAENPHYPPLILKDEMDLTVWGVVTSVIHSL